MLTFSRTRGRRAGVGSVWFGPGPGLGFGNSFTANCSVGSLVGLGPGLGRLLLKFLDFLLAAGCGEGGVGSSTCLGGLLAARFFL